MANEGNGKPEEAIRIFLMAWDESTDDLERFIASHYIARHQSHAADKLKWLETNLQYALKTNADAIKSSLPTLYQGISKCYRELGDFAKADYYDELANTCNVAPTDKGPFYHGTKAALKTGDLLNAGGISNYKAELKMNHIYFTALLHGAGLAAALAKGEGGEHVYVVEPTGSFENDPNVTNKKFPGNLTRSYRSEAPLKIIGEITDWKKITPEELKKWHEKLANNEGEIIN